MLIVIRRTMEPVGPLTLARWQARAIIGTDRPTKAFRTAPKPFWAKRKRQLAASSAIVLTGATKLSEPKKCARGLPMHRVAVAVVAEAAPLHLKRPGILLCRLFCTL